MATSKIRPSGSLVCVFIEPAPYMVALTKELRKMWPSRLNALFVYNSLTQNWGATDEEVILLPGRFGSLVQILRALFNLRPDFVLVAGWQNFAVVLTILASRVLGIKVVAMSDTWISRSGFLRNQLKKILLSNISHFVPGGTAQKAYLMSLGVDESRIAVTNMTVDARPIDAFRDSCTEATRKQYREDFGFVDGDVVFIFVGRLSEEKGVEVMLDSFKLVESENPRAKLLMVGGEVSYNIQTLQERASRNVVFTDRLATAELYRAYTVADVFVGTSLREPWGLVVNEAMMFGLPVIVADCYGCAPDLVSGKNTGIISITGDAESFAVTMLRLAADEEQRLELGENGAELISGWTIVAQAQKIIEGWSKTRL